jgi:CheY-like chemotaxis protein
MYEISVRSFDAMTYNGITVLVVEDEPLTRMDVVFSLEACGFQVFEAANADAAIEILNTHSIQLLFTDIDMPGTMDGLKLATAVRNRWPPVKVIVTSGNRHLADDILPVEVRFFDKPYDPDKVMRAMKDMLSV